MSKLKKAYCIVSICIAVLVFGVSLYLSMGSTTVYASSTTNQTGTSSDTASDLTQTSQPSSEEDGDSVVDGLSITYNNDTGSVSSPIKIILFLTVLSLAPSILIMLTSYTRIIIVLHFVRSAIGTQTSPPNQILIALALFLTFFIMWPTFQEINENAIQPLDAGEITMEQALE